MLDVLKVLERLGSDATLRATTLWELERSLLAAGIGTDLRRALLLSDKQALERMLGANSHVCCLIRTPDDEPEQPDDDEPDEQEEDDQARLSLSMTTMTSGSALLE